MRWRHYVPLLVNKLTLFSDCLFYKLDFKSYITFCMLVTSHILYEEKYLKLFPKCVRIIEIVQTIIYIYFK